MLPEEIKTQVEFAKSHSTVIDESRGAVLFKGSKTWIVGFSRLPLDLKYSSEESPLHTELHINAVQDAIMKVGSYRKVVYSDLDIALSDEPTLNELALIVDMGFKRLWILGKDKALKPDDYLREAIRKNNLKF